MVLKGRPITKGGSLTAGKKRRKMAKAAKKSAKSFKRRKKK
jgi:hypothetical protein